MPAQKLADPGSSILALIDPQATIPPYHRLNRVAAMIQGDAHSAGVRRAQYQRTIGQGRVDQRHARHNTLRQKSPRVIDDHPFAIVREAALGELGRCQFDAPAGFDRVNMQCGERNHVETISNRACRANADGDSAGERERLRPANLITLNVVHADAAHGVERTHVFDLFGDDLEIQRPGQFYHRGDHGLIDVV